MNTGYTTIKINGETIGLKFGMHAIETLRVKLNEYSEMLDTVQDKDGNQGVNSAYAAAILYAGYKNNCLAKEKKPVHPFAYFTDWIDSIWFDAEQLKPVDAVINVFAESPDVKRTVEAAAAQSK